VRVCLDRVNLDIEFLVKAASESSQPTLKECLAEHSELCRELYETYESARYYSVETSSPMTEQVVQPLRIVIPEQKHLKKCEEIIQCPTAETLDPMTLLRSLHGQLARTHAKSYSYPGITRT
jgi:hypothetical protein